MAFLSRLLLWLILTGLSSAWATDHPAIEVIDDSGTTIHLIQPAKRIISLAPDLTELLFTVGAGDHIVGTVDYSDYPEDAKKIAHVGSYARLDIEAILAKKPDLIVAWQSGNLPADINKLKKVGIPVFIVQTSKIEDIVSNLERLAILTAANDVALQRITDFKKSWRTLTDRQRSYPNKQYKRIRVFYQISGQPILTIGGKQIISNIIELCGGENVFASLAGMAPVVSVEAVIAAKPEIIIGSGMDNLENPAWLQEWNRWPQIPAVANHQIHFIPPDYLHRQSTRILHGAQAMCEKLDNLRRNPDQAH